VRIIVETQTVIRMANILQLTFIGAIKGYGPLINDRAMLYWWHRFGCQGRRW
jgi:hypothetical protein